MKQPKTKRRMVANAETAQTFGNRSIKCLHISEHSELVEDDSSSRFLGTLARALPYWYQIRVPTPVKLRRNPHEY